MLKCVFYFSEQINDIIMADFIISLFIKSALFYLIYNGMWYAGIIWYATYSKKCVF